MSTVLVLFMFLIGCSFSRLLGQRYITSFLTQTRKADSEQLSPAFVDVQHVSQALTPTLIKSHSFDLSPTLRSFLSVSSGEHGPWTPGDIGSLVVQAMGREPPTFHQHVLQYLRVWSLQFCSMTLEPKEWYKLFLLSGHGKPIHVLGSHGTTCGTLVSFDTKKNPWIVSVASNMGKNKAPIVDVRLDWEAWQYSEDLVRVYQPLPRLAVGRLADTDLDVLHALVSNEHIRRQGRGGALHASPIAYRYPNWFVLPSAHDNQR